MTALRYIDLGHNDIRNLFASDLAALRAVTSLAASGESGRPAVDSLNLADCGLIHIDAGAFDGLDNITSLTLSRCLANQSTLSRALVSASFQTRLLRLDVSETFIGNLTSELVGDFVNLVGLFASYCDLRTVDSDLFRRLSNLETLDVDGGRLDRLEGLDQLARLRRLSARMNQLEELILGHVDTLETVDLSYNRFRRLPTGWIGGSDIQLVNVSHNEIVTVERDAITQASTIATLDLSFNQINAFPE
jgi:Leucine-rich repeat (LRR) protein